MRRIKKRVTTQKEGVNEPLKPSLAHSIVTQQKKVRKILRREFATLGGWLAGWLDGKG